MTFARFSLSFDTAGISYGTVLRRGATSRVYEYVYRINGYSITRPTFLRHFWQHKKTYLPNK
jgi:hypothetical protein